MDKELSRRLDEIDLKLERIKYGLHRIQLNLGIVEFPGEPPEGISIHDLMKKPTTKALKSFEKNLGIRKIDEKKVKEIIKKLEDEGYKWKVGPMHEYYLCPPEFPIGAAFIRDGIMYHVHPGKYEKEYLKAMRHEAKRII